MGAILVLAILAQMLVPPLLALFQRDAARIAQGEWWRMATALFFQDGWFAGGVTNILALLVVGALAEQVLRRTAWLAIHVGGGLIAECVALSWQPVGAGNSVAVCALAGALLVTRPAAGLDGRQIICRIVAAAAALILLSTENIHGVGALAGTALGVIGGRAFLKQFVI
jgi:rhomboid protease GluP